MGDTTKGLYNKYRVRRSGNRDLMGDKHYGCEYFVLDVTHDRHAIAALRGYIDSCQAEYPLLAQDLRAMVFAKERERNS